LGQFQQKFEGYRFATARKLFVPEQQFSLLEWTDTHNTQIGALEVDNRRLQWR
jgi:hypothetical protein